MASSFNRKSDSSASSSSRRSSAAGKRSAVPSSAKRKSIRKVPGAGKGRISAKSARESRAERDHKRSAHTAFAPTAAESEAPASSSDRRGSKEASRRQGSCARRSVSAERASKRAARSQRKKDAAPAGTDNLALSDSDKRRRNRDMDEVAAGGRRVGDIRASRAAERAARARKRYLSYVLKLAAVVATVLVVVFGSIFIYRSNLLAITSVTVSGSEHLTDQEVTQLAAVPDDSTLLRLDTAGICERLQEHPWVQSATVVRQFPNSIKIQITERTPSAGVKISKKSIWVISMDGAWLSAATKDDWKSYRRIVDADASMSAPVAGSECTNEGVLNALKIYDGVSSKLAEQIESISAESAVKTSLTLKDGITVAFGEAEDLELKEADIWTLLEKYDGTISYINVRVPDRPTYRSAKE